MRWTYDLSANALYVYLNDQSVAGQIEMPDGTIVDVDAEGAATGIEVLSPAEGWDVNAIMERFRLDEDTRKSLGFFLMSPLMMRTPARREPKVALTTTGERPAEPASNARVLVAA
jgi:uncharacterized protein YuzE